jgi:hypothetical protein
MQGCLNFDFLSPLVADMTQVDPAKRPSIDEVVSQFDTLQKKINKHQRDSKVLYTNKNFVRRIFRKLSSMLKQLF